MEKSNNSNFVIFIFEISKFRNIGCSKFGRFKYWPPPANFNKEFSGVWKAIARYKCRNYLKSKLLKLLTAFYKFYE